MQTLRVSFLLIAVTASSTACSPSPGPAEEVAVREQSILYRAFFDQTGSVPARQQSYWASLFESDVVSHLSSGDRLEIYRIHDLTAESTPILIDDMPLLPTNARLSQIAEYRQHLKSSRQAAVAKIQSDLTGDRGQAKATSILGVIDLHQPDHFGRPIRLIIFSDMLESAEPFLNLEKLALSGKDTGELIDRLNKKRGWSENTLTGVEVFCVVRSYQAGEDRPLNDRRMLESFWTELFGRLGATVASFNTHFVKPPARATSPNSRGSFTKITLVAPEKGRRR